MLALLNRPRLVILDELTQGLDPAARRDVWAAVAQLHADGTTVLLVTHELDEAEALCDRVVVMRAGRVLDAGPPAELVARHAGWATVCSAGRTRAGAAAGRDRPARRRARRACGPARRVDRATATGAVIAYVGAALVRRGPVPDDLAVHVPDLEDALLGLLERAAVRRPARHTPTPDDLVGGAAMNTPWDGWSGPS